MKKLFIALLLSILPCLALAQETMFKYDRNGDGYRLYNSRTGRWMSNEVYQHSTDFRDLGPYAGTYYYGVYKNNLWGIMDETGKFTANYRFEEIDQSVTGAVNGFLRVKNNGSWGLADVYGHIIIGCRYKHGYLYSNVVKFYDWKDNKEYTWRMDQLVAMRDNIIKEEKAREELAAKADKEKAEHERKEIITAKPAEAAAANQTARPQRPSISIIAPGNNTTYSSPLVRIRYQATVFDQSTPTLHVWVNGSETEFVTKNGKPKSKGVAANWEEIELTLPKDREHPCNIMLSITDGSGYSSENKTISLSYVGEMPKPKLYIFSVGISNYQSSTLAKLGYASKDAKDFVNTITSSDVSMYEEIVAPVILTDKDATKSNIEKGLSNLTKTVGQDDVVFLYFSGHGMLDGEDAYFMSVDASSEEPYTGVDFALIRKNMVKLKDKKCKVVIFMDACYSGAMFNAKSNIKNITFADNGIIGFYSSTASQTSAEFSSDGNGLFTKALIEGLKGKAKNRDGEITTFGLQKYISDVVNQKTGGKQSPIVENKLGDLVLYKIK